MEAIMPKKYVKDQYDKDYQKGKVKKFKKKIEYIKPNYFELYKQHKNSGFNIEEAKGEKFSKNKKIYKYQKK